MATSVTIGEQRGSVPGFSRISTVDARWSPSSSRTHVESWAASVPWRSSVAMDPSVRAAGAGAILVDVPEPAADEELDVRLIQPYQVRKAYVCPGCNQDIAAGF